MLARGARPPGCAETPAADVVAGSVIPTAARLAAVLAVPVLLARFVGAEAGRTVRQQVRTASAKLLLTVPKALVWERHQRWRVAALAARVGSYGAGGSDSGILQVTSKHGQRCCPQHHFTCPGTVLLDARALTTFNNSALSQSPPVPRPEPTHFSAAQNERPRRDNQRWGTDT